MRARSFRASSACGLQLELETTENTLRSFCPCIYMRKEKETKTVEKLAETEKDLAIGDKLTNTQRQLELARAELEAHKTLGSWGRLGYRAFFVSSSHCAALPGSKLNSH